MTRSPRGLGLLLVLAGVVAYANGLGGEFLFDDRTNILQNEGIRRLPPGDPVPVTLLRRPVVRWSFALNHAVGGLDPVGYRATNVAIHVLAALLLFGLVRRSLATGDSGRGAEGRAAAVAVSAALVWLVHPLQTESVTYVSQRLESLMGLFFLAGLYALVRGASASRSWPWYGAAVAAGTLGMGTKEVMLMGPVVWALYDRLVLSGSWREVWRARRWLYLGLVPPAAALVAAAAPTVRSADYALGFGLSWISPWAYLGAQPGVILHYLRLAFWPDRLCLDYGWPLASSVLEVLGPALLVGGLALASLLAVRRAPRLAFLGLAFFLLLAPTSSVMPLLEPAAEHRMYLPLACVVVAAVLGAERLLGRLGLPDGVRRGTAGVVLVAVILALGWRTAVRNRDYRSEIGMWEDVVACAPGNPRGHRNLGLLVGKRGEHERAVFHLRRAVEIEPRYTEARQNLADELRLLGHVEEALREYRAVLAVVPNNAQVHNNLANLLQAQGDTAGAVRHYEAAVAADPGYALAWDNFGVAKAQSEDYAGAVALFRRAIRADPGLASAHLHLGLALEALGRSAEAVEPLREALRLDPQARGALRGLVRIGAAQADPALIDAAEAVRLAEQLTAGGRAGTADDLALLAGAYALAGRFPEAVRAAELARMRADDAERAIIDQRIGCYRAGHRCEERSQAVAGATA